MTPQVTPAAPAPPKGTGAGAHPVKGGAPPGLFTALLGAAATAAGPPGLAPTPARTAHAEGTPAEGDSSGHTDSHTTPSPMPALVAAAAVPPAHPAAVPAPAHHTEGRAAAAPAGETTAPAAPAGHRVKQLAAAAHQPAPEPRSGSDLAPRELPVPVVPGRPGHAPASRRTTPASGAPAPMHIPARSEARTHDPKQQPANGIQLPVAAPEHAAHSDLTAQHPRLVAGQRARHAAAAPAAASAPAVDAAPAQPAEHVSATAASAPQLPRVRVHELAESMHALVKVANRHGTAAARITLRPAALGGVQVRLRAHAGGVSASLTAQTAAGAQALGAAHGELRRALEAQGIAVHTIDVQLAGDRPGPEGRSHGWHPGSQDGPPQHAHEDDEEFEPHHTIEPTRLPLADGQVDVLA
ncbi:MAG TPA: flagellar hook-length control protein FliK [Gaiellales bacterium]|jgi:hypothetical protein|nr:flagellar hook-length control protein FliK [Gaiellales bacterium]